MVGQYPVILIHQIKVGVIIVLVGLAGENGGIKGNGIVIAPLVAVGCIVRTYQFRVIIDHSGVRGENTGYMINNTVNGGTVCPRYPRSQLYGCYPRRIK